MVLIFLHPANVSRKPSAGARFHPRSTDPKGKNYLLAASRIAVFSQGGFSSQSTMNERSRHQKER
jgi:hypothetical protein